MKRAISLEEERQALLDQIHSSRAAYRRMLSKYDQPQENSGPPDAADDGGLAPLRGMPAAFPRSRTMRWIISHPYATAGAAAGLLALAVIGPRRALASVRLLRFAPGVEAMKNTMQGTMRRRHADSSVVVPARALPPEREVTMSNKRQALGGAALASMTGLVSMLLRDPARMRMVARAASTATEWWRSRRQQASQQAMTRRGKWRG